MIQRKNGKNTLIDIFLIIIITVLIGTLLIVMCGAKPAAAYNLFFHGEFSVRMLLHRLKYNDVIM